MLYSLLKEFKLIHTYRPCAINIVFILPNSEKWCRKCEVTPPCETAVLLGGLILSTKTETVGGKKQHLVTYKMADITSVCVTSCNMFFYLKKHV